MSATRDLYQGIILQHSRCPHHFGSLTDATHRARADNPLCGDQYEVFLRVDDSGIIRDIAFQGAGCAISKASASLMADALAGRPLAEFEPLFERFHHLVMGDETAPAPERMGELAVFSGICQFPARVKCAILCWEAVRNALRRNDGGATASPSAQASAEPEGGVPAL